MTRRMRWMRALGGAVVLALCLAGLAAGLAAGGQTRAAGAPHGTIPPRTPPGYPPVLEPPDRTFCTNTRLLDAYFECRADQTWWLVIDEYWDCVPDVRVAVRKEARQTGQWCLEGAKLVEPAGIGISSDMSWVFRSTAPGTKSGELMVMLTCRGTWRRLYYEVERHASGQIANLSFRPVKEEDTGIQCTLFDEPPGPFSLPAPPRTGMSTGTKVGLGVGAGAVGLGLALRGGSSTPAPAPTPTPTPTPPPFTPAGTYTCTITVTSDPGNFAQFIQLAPNPPLTVSTGPPFAISGPSGSNWATVSGSHDAASGAFNLTGAGASGTTAVFQGTLRAPGAIEGSYTVSHPNWQTPVVYRVVCQKP